MTFWRAFSRIMLYISLVVSFILVIVMTYNVSNLYDDSAVPALLTFGIGIYAVFAIHSVWGAFLDNSEDVAGTLDQIQELKKSIDALKNDVKKKNSNQTTNAQQHQIVQSTEPVNANSHANRRYAVVSTEICKQFSETPNEINSNNNGFLVFNNNTAPTAQTVENPSTKADSTMRNEAVFEKIVWQCCECGTFNDCNDNICKGCGK